MSKKNLVIISAILALSLAIAGVAYARGGDDWRGGGMFGMMGGQKMDKEAMEKMHTAFVELHNKHRPIMLDMQAKWIEIQKELLVEKPDIAKVDKLYDEILGLRNGMQKEMFKMAVENKWPIDMMGGMMMGMPGGHGGKGGKMNRDRDGNCDGNCGKHPEKPANN